MVGGKSRWKSKFHGKVRRAGRDAGTIVDSSGISRAKVLSICSPYFKRNTTSSLGPRSPSDSQVSLPQFEPKVRAGNTSVTPLLRRYAARESTNHGIPIAEIQSPRGIFTQLICMLSNDPNHPSPRSLAPRISLVYRPPPPPRRLSTFQIVRHSNSEQRRP